MKHEDKGIYTIMYDIKGGHITFSKAVQYNEN